MPECGCEIKYHDLTYIEDEAIKLILATCEGISSIFLFLTYL